MKKYLWIALMLLTTGTTLGKDLRTVRFTTTPQMHCTNCENKVKANLRYEKGIKKIETSLEDQTVSVTYDAKKTTPEKLLKGFEKFGYKARILKDGEKVVTEAHECTEM